MYEKCQNCKCYLKIKGSNYDGICRRYPPVPDKGITSTSGITYSHSTDHTFVDREDWCGEWMPKRG